MSLILDAREGAEKDLASTFATINPRDTAVPAAGAAAGGGMIALNDPDRTATLALATSALLSDEPVVVRYPDGNACNAFPNQILGFALKR